MADVFKALADPTRREILQLLAREPASINQIAQRFTMSRPAISRHMKVLRESKLVEMKSDASDGRQVNCYVQLEALQEVSAYMMELEQFWQERFDGLGAYLDRKADEKDD